MLTNGFTTTALLSYYAWLDHHLLQKGQLFTNANTQLFPQSDGVLPAGFETFAAPFRSLVWDSSISGANQFNGVSGYLFSTGSYTSSGGSQLYSSVIFPQIPATGYGGPALQFNLSFPAYVTIPSGNALLSGNSVFFDDSTAAVGAVRLSGANSGSYSDILFTLPGSPTVISRDQNGLVLDYENGRAIFPLGTIGSKVISGSYAFKTFNLYFANQLAERTTFDDKPYLNGRFNAALSGVPPAHEMALPCVVISNVKLANDWKYLGSTATTKVLLRLDIMADTVSQVENALSLIADSQDVCFPQITRDQWPLQPSGDLKAAPYSYQALFDSLYTPANLFSITRAVCTHGSDRTKLNESVYVGRADVYIERERRPV